MRIIFDEMIVETTKDLSKFISYNEKENNFDECDYTFRFKTNDIQTILVNSKRMLEYILADESYSLSHKNVNDYDQFTITVEKDNVKKLIVSLLYTLKDFDIIFKNTIDDVYISIDEELKQVYIKNLY